MEWQPRDGSSSTGTALLVTVGDADAADVAVRAGADLLDVGPAGPATIEEIRARHPGVDLAVPWHSPAATGHPAAALPPTSRLICDNVPDAEAAQEAGTPHGAILVAAPPDHVRAVAAAGWAVVADVDRAASGPGRPAAGGQITPAQQIGNPAQDVTVSNANLRQQSRAERGAQGEADGAGAAEGAVRRTPRTDTAEGPAEEAAARREAGGRPAEEAAARTEAAEGPAEEAAPRTEAAEGPAEEAAPRTDIRRDQAAGAAPGGDAAGEISAVVAAAAICAWLGVAAVRTRHVPQVRRALDMTASIQGTRPPTWTIRALA